LISSAIESVLPSAFLIGKIEEKNGIIKPSPRENKIAFGVGSLGILVPIASAIAKPI
jgi:hypothetical protein